MKSFVAFLCIIVGLTSCTQKKTSSDEIVLGAVFPMTGPIATYGQESVNGINLALEEVNKEGVQGKKIRLIFEDNRGEPVDSANAVRKLINVNQASAIIGSVASSNTLAGAPIAQKARVPLLSPASTNVAVTKAGEYISRVCFTDNFQGIVMAKFAYESLNKRKAAVIMDNASDYSKGLDSVFRAKFKELGGEVIEEQFTYIQKDTDFRSLLKKVSASNPDVIFLPGYYSEVGLILKQARQMGITVPFLGGDGWDSPKLQELAGPEGIKGNYISTHFSAQDKDHRVQNFVKKYVETYRQKPGAMAALGYDGMLVMADALKRSTLKEGRVDMDSLKEAINGTKGFVGVTGSISLDDNRNAQKAAVIVETTAQGLAFKERISP